MNLKFLEQLKNTSGKSLGLSVDPKMLPPFQNLEEGRLHVSNYIRKIVSIMRDKSPLLGEKLKLFSQAQAAQDEEQMSMMAIEYRNIIKQVEQQVMAVSVPCKKYYYLILNSLQLQAALFNQMENFHHQAAERISQKITMNERRQKKFLGSIGKNLFKKF